MKRAKTKNGLFERWEVYKSLKGWHYNIFNDLGVKMWRRPPKYYKTKIEAVKAAKKMFYVDGPAGRWSENPKIKKDLKKGEYYGRRAVDSKIVKLSEKTAKEIIERPGGRDADDFLVVWWVPPEYVRAPLGSNESKWRIERGFIKPLWDWGQGRLISGRLSFDTVVRTENKKKAVKKTAARRPGRAASSRAAQHGFARG